MASRGSGKSSSATARARRRSACTIVTAHGPGYWDFSAHLLRLLPEDLAIPRYGGGLFEPGDPQSRDGILRALSVFENLLTSPADSAVYAIIRLITRCMVRVRQGKGATFVEDTVDFSDPLTEYIGILYEGLLDFELRKADENDPVVFLNLGDQPALPLSRVEGMNDDGLSDLIEKLKKSEKLKPSGEDAEGEEEDDDAGDAEAEIDEEDQENAGIPAAGDAETIDDDDAQRQVRDRVRKWAVKAVTAGGLVKKPKWKKKDDMDRYERDAMKMADTLIAKTVMPGTRYLVRWGGTRKGAGTFYTRPGLAVPTVHRTLRPLAYNPPAGKDGRPDIDAPPAQWTPKAPDEIIALKTCDTSMGSASFLVSALRFLTDALSAGIITHGWMIENESGYEYPTGRSARWGSARSGRASRPTPMPPGPGSRRALSAWWWNTACTAWTSTPWPWSSPGWHSGSRPWTATFPSSSWTTS
jgi:hypothetical protein